MWTLGSHIAQKKQYNDHSFKLDTQDEWPSYSILQYYISIQPNVKYGYNLPFCSGVMMSWQILDRKVFLQKIMMSQ